MEGTSVARVMVEMYQVVGAILVHVEKKSTVFCSGRIARLEACMMEKVPRGTSQHN
jgi:hypothetical protein